MPRDLTLMTIISTGSSKIDGLRGLAHKSTRIVIRCFIDFAAMRPRFKLLETGAAN